MSRFSIPCLFLCVLMCTIIFKHNRSCRFGVCIYRKRELKHTTSAFLGIDSININRWIKAIEIEECELDVKKKLDFDLFAAWISYRFDQSRCNKRNRNIIKRKDLSRARFGKCWHSYWNNALVMFAVFEPNFSMHFVILPPIWRRLVCTKAHLCFITLKKWEQEIRNIIIKYQIR